MTTLFPQQQPVLLGAPQQCFRCTHIRACEAKKRYEPTFFRWSAEEVQAGGLLAGPTYYP